MNPITRQHIEEAFLEVSRGAARKTIYALRAEQEGKSQLAKLFRAIALSEKAQALRLLLQLRGQTGTNEQNSQTAFAEEIPSLLQRYQEAANIAEDTGERAMQSAFSQSARVQRMHLSLKKKLDEDSTRDSSYHVCSFCGFIMEDHAPEKCPICTAPRSRFVKI
jgi:rubrerythrin